MGRVLEARPILPIYVPQEGSDAQAGRAVKIMLDPMFLASESLARCSIEARLVWPRILIATVDPFGCFRWNVPEITGKAFPPGQGWKYGVKDVDRWLAEYVQTGMVGRWTDSGHTYGVWVNFAKHNRIRGHFARNTPIPPDHFDSLSFTSDHFDSLSITPFHSASVSVSVSGSGSVSVPVEEAVGKPTDRVARRGSYPEDFLEFWGLLPSRCRTKKPKASAAWKAKRPPLDEVRAALRWQTRDAEWIKEDFRFFPRAEAYINGGRWEDDRPVTLKSEHPSFRAPSPYCECGRIIKDCEIHRGT